jgi:hypothetical protein
MRPKELPLGPDNEPEWLAAARALPAPEPSDFRFHFGVGAFLLAFIASLFGSTWLFAFSFAASAASLMAWARGKSRAGAAFLGFPLFAWGFLYAAGHGDSVITYAANYPFLALALALIAAGAVKLVTLDNAGLEQLFGRMRIANLFALWRRISGASSVLNIVCNAVLILALVGIIASVTPIRGWDVFWEAAQNNIRNRLPAAGLEIAKEAILPLAAESFDAVKQRPAVLDAANTTIEAAQRSALERLGRMEGTPDQPNRTRASVNDMADDARKRVAAAVNSAATQATKEAKNRILNEALQRISGAALATIETSLPEMLAQERVTFAEIQRAARDSSPEAILNSTEGRSAGTKVSDEVRQRGNAAADSEARAVIAAHQKEVDAEVDRALVVSSKAFVDDLATRLTRFLDNQETAIRLAKEKQAKADAEAQRAEAARKEQQAEAERMRDPEYRQAKGRKRLDELREAALKKAREEAERDRLASVEAEQLRKERDAKAAQERRAREETLARLGFRLTEGKGMFHEDLGLYSKLSNEDCALQCLGNARCKSFSNGDGYCRLFSTTSLSDSFNAGGYSIGTRIGN